MTDSAVLLDVKGLQKRFPVRGGVFLRTKGAVDAVSNVSFSLKAGETLGVVGESGCGKSTLARCILRLIRASAGEVTFNDTDLLNAPKSELKKLRRDMQIAFQDPYASLNPRMTVRSIVGEPLKVHQVDGDIDYQTRIYETLQRVGLNPDQADRYPHEFSGGQRQRIGIARALILEPKLIVLDEPVSALDVSIQAGVLNLLKDVQKERGLSYLFIAHDLAVVKTIADRVAVMYLGKIVEIGNCDEIYSRSGHPYTRALLSAAPIPDPVRERQRARIVLQGDVPSPINPPSGCRFRTRCWKAQELCAREEPLLIDRGQGHPVACHFPETGSTETSG